MESDQRSRLLFGRIFFDEPGSYFAGKCSRLQERVCVGVRTVELRGRRRERAGFNARAGMYLLTGRRSRIGTLTARRPRPQARPDTGHPQLTDDADRLSTGEDRQVLLTSWNRLEGSRMYAAPVLRRAVSLTSDAILLTLASPIFAAWWIVRAIRKRR
jgi:hypothetical protein